MKLKRTIWLIGFLIVVLLMGNCAWDSNTEFISSSFISDTSKYKLRQVFDSPYGGNFVAIFYQESSKSFGSGNKLMKLYSEDSMSIDECFYGSHPLELKEWSDSTIWLNCSVIPAHGDSAYRKWYLDNSVDKNLNIGKYKIAYLKNYNYSSSEFNDPSITVENQGLIGLLNSPIDLNEFKTAKGISNSSIANGKPYHYRPDSIKDIVYYWYTAFPADTISERLISPVEILVYKHGSGKHNWKDKNEALIELKVSGKDLDLKLADLTGWGISEVLATFGDGYIILDNYYIYLVGNKILILEVEENIIKGFRSLKLNTDKIDSALIRDVIKNK